MEILPDSIIFKIFTFLDYNSFLISSMVCKKWNRIIADNIDFFSSFFVDNEEEGKEINNKEEKSENEKNFLLEEQIELVNQINFLEKEKKGIDKYFDILGVSQEAEEEEIRNQYKKLALLLHPDKNKTPDALRAFQNLKKAFDIVINGIDPQNFSNICQINCPNVECNCTIYLLPEKYKLILQGKDIGFCKACKKKFGKIFCPHCFNSWVIVLIPNENGKLVTCSVCYLQFSLQFPNPSLLKRENNNNNSSILKKKVTKKIKKNWWE